jgi:hypothetical protein
VPQVNSAQLRLDLGRASLLLVCGKTDIRSRTAVK